MCSIPPTPPLCRIKEDNSVHQIPEGRVRRVSFILACGKSARKAELGMQNKTIPLLVLGILAADNVHISFPPHAL